LTIPLIRWNAKHRLQVLEAQRQNQQARIGLVHAQSQRLQDTVQLLLALGGRVPPI